MRYLVNSLSVIIALALIICLSVGQAEKEIPMTRFSQSIGSSGPTMTFLYCHSCGYRKAFEDYTNVLAHKYPDISVIGANYDPPSMSFYLSKSILFLKLVFILVIMSSFNIWGYLGQATVPGWYDWCLNNKLYACMMIFFVGNMLEAQLIASGAFEISLNDVPVWSKLQTGRIPAPQELFQIIDSHFLLANKVPDFIE